MKAALAQHDEILRQAVEGSAGHIVKTTGDGCYAVFPGTHDGLAAALTAQQALLSEAWATIHPDAVRARMALHTGEAELRDRDYFGPALNRTARLLALGHGGQVLLSAVTAELVRDRRQRLARARLLTLTGAGGTGKTRLALEIAASLIPETGQGRNGPIAFPDGVWLVELAPLAAPTLVADTVAAALGLRPTNRPAMALEGLVDHLRGKRLLLLLDNCEHLIAACAELADALLRTYPRVTILATSREVLNIAGETVWTVPSLTPDEAVQLFAGRAGAVQPRFELTAHNWPVVMRLCERLDGIPLAIELAAARLRTLSLEQVAARLDDRFRLLVGGSRTALPHHQTLRATLEWSYNLLSEPERVLLKGHYAQAEAILKECLALWRRQHVRWDAGVGSAQTLFDLGQLAWLCGDHDSAKHWYDQSLEEYQQVGDVDRMARLHLLGGYILLAQGDQDHAFASFRHGLRLYRELGQPGGISMAVAALGAFAEARGQIERAVRLFGAASVPQDTPSKQLLTPASNVVFQHEIAAARNGYQGTEYAAAWAEGERMTLDQGFSPALGSLATPGQVRAHLVPIDERTWLSTGLPSLRRQSGIRQ